MDNRARNGFAAALIAIGVPSAAIAEEYNFRDAFLVCAEIDDSSQRLHCFDDLARASGAADRRAQATVTPPPLASEQESRTVAAPPQAVTQENERRYVILSSDDPRAKQDPRKVRYERPDTYEAAVAAARLGPYKELMIKLDNGEVWKQIWPNRKLKTPAVGAKVSLERGLGGGWFMQIGDKTALKVILVSE
jgi:hypothetical protein